MSRNGVGVYNRAVASYVYNTVIDQVVVNAEMDDIATALTASIAKDGQTTPTANLPMGTYRHTGVGNASARTDYAAAGQVQDGKLNWVDGGGTADAITATYSPAITALVDGQLCYVRATAANATTTPTFAPSGLTARTIVKTGGNALLVGDIAGGGHELELRYDLSNTQWELLNPKDASRGANTFTGLQTFAAGADIASATTVDLTAATGNLVRITGTTATTGFTINNGQVVFLYPTGNWPLTYHATNMPIKGGVSVTVEAGGTVIVSKDGNGTLHVDIFKADGTALVGTTETAWTDYSATSTIVGWSSFTTKQIYYKDVGKTRFVTFFLHGPSNSATTTFTVPNASSNDVQVYAAIRVTNNTTEGATGLLNIIGNSSTVTCYTGQLGAWVASGTKIAAGQFTYQLP